VTGQVRETASNSKISDTDKRNQEPVAEQHAVETPKKQFNWWVVLLCLIILSDSNCQQRVCCYH
jgi:hypothetical protein